MFLDFLWLSIDIVLFYILLHIEGHLELKAI